jgi:hypothetical protein
MAARGSGGGAGGSGALVGILWISADRVMGIPFVQAIMFIIKII